MHDSVKHYFSVIQKGNEDCVTSQANMMLIIRNSLMSGSIISILIPSTYFAGIEGFERSSHIGEKYEHINIIQHIRVSEKSEKSIVLIAEKSSRYLHCNPYNKILE